jgi:bacillolysin
LDRNLELVSIDAEIAEVKGVLPIASISAAEAIKAVAEKAGVPVTQLSEINSPKLTFFYLEDRDTWHLAYFVKHVPAAPKEFVEAAAARQSRGHGLGKSPRSIRPILNYLVDAHSAEVLFYYSATPMLSPAIDIPSKCQGLDVHGQNRDFMGRKIQIGFEMWDPLRSIGTYDLGLKDIDTASCPPNSVYNHINDWQNGNTAAVSAHVNATIVYNFFKSVLMRDSIDDKGMELISIVNCTYHADEPPPLWRNAVWYNSRMWYGQDKNAQGELQSYSRFLDVIAHELTHGITEHTSDLVYRNQSGALNESFSDIFGIMITNWHAKKWNSVADWRWEIGLGLGSKGGPLRDMSDPTRTGDPDHMNQYLRTQSDNGGVHTNSNIHNKAAYNVLASQNNAHNYIFTPEEVATLYYLCLTRLDSMATFSKILQVLTDVACTFYAGKGLNIKKSAIQEAYDKVGIR